MDSAISSKADYLVTGDKKDFHKPELKGKYEFQILSPSEFVKEILPEIFGRFLNAPDPHPALTNK